MQFKAVDYGPARGVMALHLSVEETGSLPIISKKAAEWKETFGIGGVKSLLFFDGTADRSWNRMSDQEILDTLTLVRDMGFKIMASHLGSERPCWHGTGLAFSDITVVDKEEEFLGFSTNSIVYRDIPDAAKAIHPHLDGATRHLRLGLKVDVARLMRFLEKSPYLWGLQLGPVGGPEVLL